MSSRTSVRRSRHPRRAQARRSQPTRTSRSGSRARREPGRPRRRAADCRPDRDDAGGRAQVDRVHTAEIDDDAAAGRVTAVAVTPGADHELHFRALRPADDRAEVTGGERLDDTERVDVVEALLVDEARLLLTGARRGKHRTLDEPLERNEARIGRAGGVGHKPPAAERRCEAGASAEQRPAVEKRRNGAGLRADHCFLPNSFTPASGAPASLGVVGRWNRRSGLANRLAGPHPGQ